MGVIAQKFTSDISQVEAAYSKLQSQNAQLINQNKRLTKESEKASRSSKKNASAMGQAASSAVGNIAGMVAGYVSLQGAISLVNRTLEDKLKISQEIADFGSRVAPSQAGLAINMVGMPQEQQQHIVKQITQISRDSDFGDLPAMTEAVGGMISATGDVDLSLNVVRHLGSIMRSRPDELAETSGAVGDIATIIGDETGKESLGLVLSTMKSSRLTKIDSFKNIAQGMAGTAAFEGEGVDATRSAEVSGSLQAALSRGMKDPEARSVRTASISLAAQLADFLPDHDRLDGDGSVVQAGTGLKSLEARLAAIQGDATLRRQFLENASFEKKAVGAIKQLLESPESQVAKDFRDNLGGGIAADESLVDELKATMANLTPQSKGEKFNKGVQAELDAFMSESTGDSLANVQKMLAGVLPQTRDANALTPGFMDDFVARQNVNLAAAMGMSPAESAAEILRERELSILQSNGVGEGFVDDNNQIAFRDIDLSKVSRAELEKLKLLEGVIGELRQVTDNINRTQLGTALNADRGRHQEAEQ